MYSILKLSSSFATSIYLVCREYNSKVVIHLVCFSQRTVMLESRQNKLRKHYQPVQHSAQRIAQNYSTSTFNSTELAKDIIRQNLDKVLPNNLVYIRLLYIHVYCLST